MCIEWDSIDVPPVVGFLVIVVGFLDCCQSPFLVPSLELPLYAVRLITIITIVFFFMLLSMCRQVPSHAAPPRPAVPTLSRTSHFAFDHGRSGVGWITQSCQQIQY